MQGTWSMVFRGKEVNINMLMEKVDALDKNGEYEYVLEQWYDEMDLSNPDQNGDVELRINEGDSGAIGSMPDVLEAFCRMAPGVEGALYSHILDEEDVGGFAYFAPGMETVILFDPTPVWDEEEEDDDWFDEELGENILVRYGNDGMLARVPKKYVFVVELFEDITEVG